jgi:hypothetical protein
MGRSGMSCDSCHPEGHDEGVLFEKTHPLRIYRSPTVRGARETPPYFTPASTRSLAETARMVGDRNRYMNPTLTESEVRQLTLFSATVTNLPNPYRGPDGAPPAAVALPEAARAVRWRAAASSTERPTAPGAIPRRSSPPTRS